MVAEELVTQVDTYMRLCQRKLIIDNLAEKCLRNAVVSRNALIRCARMKKAWIVEERNKENKENEQRNMMDIMSQDAAKNHDVMETEETEEEKGHFGQAKHVVISLRVGTAHHQPSQGNPPTHPVAPAITITTTTTTTTSFQIRGKTHHMDNDEVVVDGDDAMIPVSHEGQKAGTQSEHALRVAKDPLEGASQEEAEAEAEAEAEEMEEVEMMEELLCSGRVFKPLASAPYVIVAAAPCSASPAASFSSLPPLPFPTYPSPSHCLKRMRSEAEVPDNQEPQQPQRRTKRSRSLGDIPATFTTQHHHHHHHHPQQQQQQQQSQKPVVCSC